MTSTLKQPGFTGNVTITVDGVETSITDYGNPPPPPTDVVYAMTNNRTAVFTDPAEPDSVEITTAPSRGRITARGDGRFTMDMQGTDPLDDSDVTFAYNRTKDSVTTAVTATIQLENNYRNEGGWLKPRYPSLAWDRVSNRLIAEPVPSFSGGPVHRNVYVTVSSTLTRAAIAAREGLTEDEISDNWLRLNPAAPGVDFPDADGVLYYGEIPELALPPIRQVANLISGLWERSEWHVNVWYKRGDTFPLGFALEVNILLAGTGFSALHPQIFGAYGTGAKPIAQGKAINLDTYARGIILQDLVFEETGFSMDGQNIAIDHVELHGGKLNATPPSNNILRGYMVRGLKSMDSNKDPGSLTEWPWNEVSAYITEGMYAANIDGILLTDTFITGAGWGYDTGYRMDRSTLAGQSPFEFSHSAYWGLKVSNAHVHNVIFAHGCFSSMQLRCGGLVDGAVMVGHNGSINPGNGPNDIVTGSRGNGRGSAGVNWSMLDNMVFTWAGFKDRQPGGNGNDFDMALAGAIEVACDKLSMPNVLVINDGGLPGVVSDLTQVVRRGIAPGRGAVKGGKWFAVKISSNNQVGGNNISRNGAIVSNWARSLAGDSNVGSVPQGTRDALTIMDWTDDKKSETGNTAYTFDDYLRTLDEPISVLPEILDHFMIPFGTRSAARTTPTTVLFQPDPAGDTPACLALYARDWSTGDLPGSVAGDSADLDGHRVRWNMTTKTRLVDFTFGAGGHLQMLGGILDPSGSWIVDAGGNTIDMENGARIEIGDYSSANVLTINAYESQIKVTGTVTGAVEATVRARGELLIDDGASLSLPSGRVLTLGGTALAGFTGTGSMTIGNGAFLRFEVGSIFRINNCKTYGSTATGDGATRNVPRGIGKPDIRDGIAGVISGTTAICGAVYCTGDSAFEAMYDNIEGSGFGSGEQVSGPTWCGMYFIGDSRTDSVVDLSVAELLSYYGTVNGTPTYQVCTIRDFPGGSGTVTLAAGSTVEVGQVDLLAPGTHVLIENVVNEGASLPPGVSVSGGSLIVTV